MGKPRLFTHRQPVWSCLVPLREQPPARGSHGPSFSIEALLAIRRVHLSQTLPLANNISVLYSLRSCCILSFILFDSLAPIFVRVCHSHILSLSTPSPSHTLTSCGSPLAEPVLLQSCPFLSPPVLCPQSPCYRLADTGTVTASCHFICRMSALRHLPVHIQSHVHMASFYPSLKRSANPPLMIMSQHRFSRLIHGTFQGEHTWIQHGSLLCPPSQHCRPAVRLFRPLQAVSLSSTASPRCRRLSDISDRLAPPR